MSVCIDLTGKTAVVTGGARGSGLAIVSKLISCGCECYVIDVVDPDLNDLKEYGLHRDSYTYIYLDLSSKDLESNVRSKLEILPDINFIVNNAGITIGNTLFDYTVEDWQNTIQINLTAPFIITKVLSEMKILDGGSVINITSLAAEQGFPNNPAYLASKGGLKQLTQSLAYDLASKNIRVNNVGPGYIKTNMTAVSWADLDLRKDRSQHMLLDRWGSPTDVANAVLFFCSDLSSYITGQSLYVDGGWLTKGL
jgi:NAD(P)-dependent dehydrogenase (short-subunit alcohol dehydrogenase family)